MPGEERQMSDGIEPAAPARVLAPGLTGSVTLSPVGPSDLAMALGSGDLAVLGTPRVVALLEAAAVAALEGTLPPDSTSVGISLRVRHTAPTLEGATVIATAELLAVDGRRLTFRVEATDDAGPVADGEHERVVVRREAFLERARQRASDEPG
jgi:fluoroacetyl-CoA thioesterase